MPTKEVWNCLKCGKTFDTWKKWKAHTAKCGKEDK